MNSVTLAPEWAPQRAIWTAWPSRPEEWNGDLEPPRRDVAALIGLLAPTNNVLLLVSGNDAERSARAAVGNKATIVRATYGDIWLRDTGPLFTSTPSGPLVLQFKTNGWGGKYPLPGDEAVGRTIAGLAGVPVREFSSVLEGGAICHDGDGTFLATRQTLLNANRNGWSERKAEDVLLTTLGARKIIWLNEGIAGDHTDGHVDNVARFVGPARIVCQTPSGADDPNKDVFEDIMARLHGSQDARGRTIEIIPIPSPGRVLSPLGEVAPASYLNFVIANGIVVAPLFGTNTETEALKRLQAAFPDRKVAGLSAAGILGAGDAGGGAFHCITCEEPDYAQTPLPTK